METIILLQWIFDSLIGLGLLWLTWKALTTPDLFKAIVLFITFGLLLTLAWVRLDAPDIALAEAAIGAGLTGALLLAALAKLRSTNPLIKVVEPSIKQKPKVSSIQWGPAVVSLLVAVGLGNAVLSLPSYAPGLSLEVSEKLDSSGVSNPVTAVMLNFRGYDTLLEMIVLLVALVGVWSIGSLAKSREDRPDIVLDNLSRFLTPLLILVAAYLLWIGAHAPGGAFQAGSVLGAAGVLLLLTGWRLQAGFSALPLRLLLVAGSGTFVAMAVFTLLVEGQLLKFPIMQAGIFILLIETAATISIGITLAALFLGGNPIPKK